MLGAVDGAESGTGLPVSRDVRTESRNCERLEILAAALWFGVDIHSF